MTKQIAVTMPDSLYERLQVVKGRFVVSAVCQDAIERAIEIEEINMKEIPSMDKLIERLKIQAEQESEDWRKQGSKDGQEGATDLDLADFRLFEKLEYSDAGVMRVSLNDDFYRSTAFDYIKEQWLEGDYYRDNGGPEGDSEEAYLEGWVKGALLVWEQIKAKGKL
ncbi:MAG: hypothetical protein WBA57_27520 [Elainellaceae cyanobacterium]